MIAILLVTAASQIGAAAPSSSRAGSDLVACLGAGKPTARWELAPLFREVSGLALAPDGRLFLHADERAVIGVIDPKTGKAGPTYPLGAAPRGDFEGLAVGSGKLYLTTSDGVLLEAALPAATQPAGSLPFTSTVTGLGRQCEIEGLGYDPRDRVLLFACKTPRAPGLARTAAVFRWSIERKALATPDRIAVPMAAIGRGKRGQFQTSAIDFDPRTGTLVLVTSADQGVAVVDRGGRVVGHGPLAKGHRQPEGLAVSGDGTVYLADEGLKTPGTISVYACR